MEDLVSGILPLSYSSDDPLEETVIFFVERM
jgi:hypothetical protein